jgi:hypothetical protein
MEAHRTFCNGKAQANPASLAAASVIQAIKRLEQLFQRIGWNAGTTISNPNDGVPTTRAIRHLQTNFDGRSLTRVTDGIPYYILNCTVEQGWISADTPAAKRNRAAYVAAPRLSFELRILGYAKNNFIQQNGRGR